MKSLVDQGEDLTIALAAPTGKAAMRLQASLGDLDGLPEVKTLHRLLGYRPGTGEFRHGPRHPLAADLVIVDEVSMIDLAMMNRLLGALHDDARLILLGDPGQLPSVEAGNLLADICKYGFPLSRAGAAMAARVANLDETPQPTGHKLQDSLCELIDSHRFSPERGIGRLAAAIRRGETVHIEDDDEVSGHPIRTLTGSTLIEIYREYIDSIERGDDDETLAALLDSVRVLVPMREGDYGVTTLNVAIEDALRLQGLAGSSPFYHGRPILVTRNDYNLRLYNGDVGICLMRGQDEPRVVFHGGGERREFLASRLPGHETCFAMTVHKSQGSEFDHVALALPAPATASQAQLLTREMFYTAITRARRRVSLYFDERSLELSLERHTVRHSGLGERLLLASPTPDQGAPGQMDLL
ncbi:MAG: exodeoxyribonuclease V subunit alpha [Gammaproteobacteria bacterium]|nr:exodeoxyribonuclease V subunit alpha [Gammaproteobacteria bacterium]